MEDEWLFARDADKNQTGMLRQGGDAAEGHLLLLDEVCQVSNAGRQLLRAVLGLREVQVLVLHILPEVRCQPGPVASCVYCV